MILAERVYTDKETDQHIIAGTFNEYASGSFPAEFVQNAAVFLSVTDFQGELPITLRYIDLQSNEVLLETEPLLVESKDRLLGCEMSWALPRFPIPHPGTYVFEAYVANEAIGSVRFSARKIKD